MNIVDDKKGDQAYRQMWEDFGKSKAKRYNELKFLPINRVGLTNFIREEIIIRLFQPIPHDAFLDIGCASGRQVFLLAPDSRRAVGVDIAASFIDECTQHKKEVNSKNTEFYVADFTSLPAGEFDVVICAEVLEHVPELDFCIDQIDEHIRSGGYAIITVPHYNADGTWWGRIMRLLRRRKFIPMDCFTEQEIRNHGDAHVREFSRKQLRSHFESRGYRIERLLTVSHLDGPYGDKIISALLERIPWTRNLLIIFEHILQRIFPGLGRHIVLLARRG